jgi:hypothetical protein
LSRACPWPREDVTGREAIKKITGDERIADELNRIGFVWMPRDPTDEMMSASYNDALKEDARAVCEVMIGVSEGVLTEYV